MRLSGIPWLVREFLAVTFSFLFLSAQIVHAQVDTGSITGTVKDASGAVVSGAKVTLTNEDTGFTLATTTGSEGTYTFSPVRIANYRLDAQAQGFQKVTQTSVVVNVNANVRVDFTLKPGSTETTVEVTAAAPVLQVQDASVGQVINQQNVNNLPLNGRNFTFLAQLAAGVNSPQADTRGNAASGAFAANGNRPAQNNYMLDGIDNNSDTVDFLNGTNYVVLPPVDAVQEFKVQTSDFSAEFGRSGAAVLNASIKSGTNQFHGNVWEFFRNDKLDARDFFERGKKGELRQNQYGFTIGGPVLIPHVFDGRNKVFFFADYEGFKRRQGVPHQGAVPTLQERASFDSNTINLQELITDQSGTQTDALGRTLPTGTVLDPSTTRETSPGSNVWVRDPFTNATCKNATPGFNYTLANCGLNLIPVVDSLGNTRVDANAIKLLKLFPLPTAGGISSNFTSSPNLKEDRQSFDTRMDVNFSQKDNVFFRFSLVDDPQLIPAIFGGVADGGGFQEGNQTALAQQGALVFTHTFSPTTVNVARAGLNYLHTTRVSPEANNLTDIPGQFGIQDIPQLKENGGLPAFGIQGLATLGSNAFLPSDEVSSTIQVTDDFTKIYGKHTFKMGFEAQHVKFSTLQPPWSRGQFNFDGVYTNLPGASDSTENTGIAQFLLNPIRVTGPGTVDYLGGPGHENPGSNNSVFISNISLTDNGKNYYGTYFQDDWKLSPKLTINLGLRWDFFGLVYEHHAAQANFVPGGPPTGQAMYIMPPSSAANNLASNFTSLLQADNIALAVTNKYGKGLGNSQKTNFAPRFGFAYQVSEKLVARGGFGVFYNGFENRGFSPNLGENYPFQFNFQFAQPDDNHPLPFAGCTSPAVTLAHTATLETGFSCTPLDPTSPLFVAAGLALRGIQFDYSTPYSMSGNFTLQYQLTPTLSVQAGYVTSLGRHLEVFPNSNHVQLLLPKNLPPGESTKNFLPFRDFGQGGSYAITEGSSYYHGLQTKAEKHFGNGLNFLATYTWSKVRSDAFDLLNGFSAGGYRAPDVPGIGIHGDYGLANFDIRNVFHFSGGYELPFGKGKRFMGNALGLANVVAGGWSLIWSTTLQGGQPIIIPCPNNVSTATGCWAYVTPGQDPNTGIHIGPNGNPRMLNAAAFAQPCVIGSAGCNPSSPLAALGGQPSQVPGPGFRRLDLSLFKNFLLSERFRLEFRSEFFNIFNHPNFNAPGFGGNGVVAISGSTNFTSSTFGEIGSTRDAPYDPRQIQFALKLYF